MFLSIIHVEMTKVFSRVRRGLLVVGMVASLGACGGGGGEGAGDASDASGQPSIGLASYAGAYDIHTSEGTALRITVDSNGQVTSCGAAYECKGAVTLLPGTQGGALQITGSDGQSSGGLRVIFDARIDPEGRVTGTFSAESPEGKENGALTGQKVPGSPSTNPPNPTAPSNPATPTTPANPGNPGSPVTPSNPGNPTAPVIVLSSFAGKFNLRADEGTALQFTAGADGAVKSCVGAIVYVCNGQVTLESNGQGASFTVSGTDGGKPVDTSVTLTGKIDLKGNVTGAYKGNSVSEGPFSGSFTGTKEGGLSSKALGVAAALQLH